MHRREVGLQLARGKAMWVRCAVLPSLLWMLRPEALVMATDMQKVGHAGACVCVVQRHAHLQLPHLGAPHLHVRCCRVLDLGHRIAHWLRYERHAAAVCL